MLAEVLEIEYVRISRDCVSLHPFLLHPFHWIVRLAKFPVSYLPPSMLGLIGVAMEEELDRDAFALLVRRLFLAKRLGE